jgi:hypothetical protein
MRLEIYNIYLSFVFICSVALQTLESTLLIHKVWPCCLGKSVSLYLPGFGVAHINFVCNYVETFDRRAASILLDILKNQRVSRKTIDIKHNTGHFVEIEDLQTWILGIVNFVDEAGIVPNSLRNDNQSSFPFHGLF